MSDLFGNSPGEPERKWCPAIYCQDESSPAPRATPQAWIVTQAGGGFAIDEDCHGVTPIGAGEVVEFCWIVDLGDDTLTIHEDGTWDTEGREPTPPQGGILSIWEPY